MKSLTKILALLFILNLTLYASTVGTITALSGSASILREGKSLDATLGAKLQQKDSIKTFDATKVQVIFSDETIISIGKNSNFSIDEFLFEESEAPSAKFGLLNGAMRTITGKIGEVAPDKFSVKTKTATIGIRGTNFSIFAAEDGSARVFCTFGAISVTARGTSAVVTQGFYVQVSPDGAKSEPIKFTPQELKEAKEESFASNSGDDSTTTDSGSDPQSSDESAPMADSPIDTSNTENLGLVVENITETGGASLVQRQKIDTAKKIVEDELEAARIAAEEAARKAAETLGGDDSGGDDSSGDDSGGDTPIKYSLAGYGHNAVGTENTAAIVSFDVESQTFSGAYIKEQDSSENEWTYTISTTPTSFTSLDEFTTEIVDVTTTDTSATNILLNETGNFFSATDDDLESGDSMSWGEWGISIQHDTSSGDYIKTGLWVAGVATPNSVIDGYRDTAGGLHATYTGVYRANYFSGNGGVANGVASLKVDFGRDLAMLNISASPGIVSTSMYGTIINDTQNDLHNQMKADGTPYTDNYFDGRFYGTDGKSAGGIFTIMNGSSVDAKGIYQVKTTEFQAGVHPDLPE